MISSSPSAVFFRLESFTFSLVYFLFPSGVDLLDTNVFPVLERWIERAALALNVRQSCMLWAHMAYIHRYRDTADLLDQRAVTVILCAQIYLVSRYLFGRKRSSGRRGGKGEDDFGAEIDASGLSSAGPIRADDSAWSADNPNDPILPKKPQKPKKPGKKKSKKAKKGAVSSAVDGAINEDSFESGGLEISDTEIFYMFQALRTPVHQWLQTNPKQRNEVMEAVVRVITFTGTRTKLYRQPKDGETKVCSSTHTFIHPLNHRCADAMISNPSLLFFYSTLFSFSLRFVHGPVDRSLGTMAATSRIWKT